MGKRTWIDGDLWHDTEDLSSAERLLYLYLLTNDQRNVAGYYKINTRLAAFDFGTTETKFEKMLSRQQKYWVYDKETKQVLIPKFTRYNIIKSKQQYAKLNVDLNQLKPCKLHKMFLDSFVDVNGVGADLLIDEKFKRKAEGYI